MNPYLLFAALQKLRQGGSPGSSSNYGGWGSPRPDLAEFFKKLMAQRGNYGGGTPQKGWSSWWTNPPWGGRPEWPPKTGGFDPIRFGPPSQTQGFRRAP